MEFRILGRLEVVEQGRQLAPQRAKQRALLAILLLSANEVVATDQLIDAMWGETPPDTAAKALQGHVSALREGQLLGLFDLGRWDDLLTRADRILAWPRIGDEPQIRTGALVEKAAVLAHRGGAPDASSLLGVVLESARQIGDLELLARALATTALVEQEAGDSAAATRLLDEFEAMIRGRARALFLASAARVCAATGALEIGERLVTATSVGLPRAAYGVLAGRAVLAEVEAKLDEALAGYSEAAARWHEFGNVVEEAYALLGRGRCLVALARHEEAAEPLAAARTIFERLEARPLVAEVDEQLARAAAATV